MAALAVLPEDAQRAGYLASLGGSAALPAGCWQGERADFQELAWFVVLFLGERPVAVPAWSQASLRVGLPELFRDDSA